MKESFARLDTDRLDYLASASDVQMPEVLRTVAFDIEGMAKRKAPVLTGFLRNSIKAEEVNSSIWRINVWAEYGVFVELGTRKMAARPFLIPSVERGTEVLVEAWKRFFSE